MMGSLPLVVYFAHSRRLNHSHWAHPFYVFLCTHFKNSFLLDLFVSISVWRIKILHFIYNFYVGQVCY